MSISDFNRRDRDRLSWNVIAALTSSRTVEHAEEIAAHLNEQDRIKELEELAKVTAPPTPLERCELRHELCTAWQMRQRELTTQKAQKHIDRLLVWFLGYGAKARIMENLKNNIKTAMHKRELKAHIISYDFKDTVALDDKSSYEIDWIVKKTNFLTQLKNCFNGSDDTSFNVRRTTTSNDAADSITVTLTLEFWP